MPLAVGVFALGRLQLLRRRLRARLRAAHAGTERVHHAGVAAGRSAPARRAAGIISRRFSSKMRLRGRRILPFHRAPAPTPVFHRHVVPRKDPTERRRLFEIRHEVLDVLDAAAVTVICTVTLPSRSTRGRSAVMRTSSGSVVSRRFSRSVHENSRCPMISLASRAAPEIWSSCFVSTACRVGDGVCPQIARARLRRGRLTAQLGLAP